MTRTLAYFECPCGNVVKRPRGKEGEPQCLTCYEMVWIEDVEVEI